MANRMKYAFSSQIQKIPEWKFCYYDYHNLSRIIEVLETASYYQNNFRHKLFSSQFSFQHQQYARKMLEVEQIMNYCNQTFFYYRGCQMKVVQLFVQYKILEMKTKEDKYIQMSDALVMMYGKRDEDLALNCLVLFQNLYIQYVYLERMLALNIKKQEIILHAHKVLVSKYGQLDTPTVKLCTIKRYQTLINETKNQIANYIRFHHLYKSLDEANYQIGTFNNFEEHPKTGRIQLKMLFGFWIGIIITMIAGLILIINIQDISIGKQDQMSLIFAKSFPVWRGLSYLCLYLWVLGIGLKVLENNNINYHLLFAMDYHYVPTAKRVLIIAAGLTTVYLLSFCFYLFYLKNQTENQHLKYVGGYIWLTIAIIILIPLPIFHYKSRIFMLKIFLKMFITPCIGVDFKYHWITEQFISMKQQFHDIFYSISYFINLGNPMQVSLIGGNVVAIYFFVLRIMQIVRQAYQGGVFFGTPLPWALIKVSLGIATIVISFLYKIYQGNTMLVAWVVTAIVTTLYTYWFDIRFDWGLLSFNCSQKHYFILRKNMIFPFWSYYIIMIINLILRMAWVFTISNGFIQSLPFPSYLFILIISFLQIIRRGIWNVLRVENEHLTRCEKFSAIVDYQNVERKVYDAYSKKQQQRDKAAISLKLNQIEQARSKQQLEQVKLAIEKKLQNKQAIEGYLQKNAQFLQEIKFFAYQEKISPPVLQYF